jgi:hypothetical protein
MGNVKNIIVGAARVFVSNGSGSNRPDLNNTATFPVTLGTGSAVTGGVTNVSSNVSAAQYLGTTASGFWRDMGYTNNGVEISYEPGYGEVMVDQLLDAARLFKQTLKILIKTEITEGTLENLNVVLGQSDSVTTYSPGAIGGTEATEATLTTYNNSVTALRLSAGALGDTPVERSLVLVGQAPGQTGRLYDTAATSSSGANVTVANQPDISAIKKKERVYVARRVVQMNTTAHALKRDSATVFPVEFRCLPDDADAFDGSEYGFIIDRVYGA